jgi:hypothetical protein
VERSEHSKSISKREQLADGTFLICAGLGWLDPDSKIRKIRKKEMKKDPNKIKRPES